jgi:hypothetical protein
MSVKINDMSGTVFSSTPSGVTRTAGDISSFASTTAFVKSVIATTFIGLGATITLIGNYIFGTIYANRIQGTSNLTLRGDLSIGGATTTLKILNNTVGLDASYPYVLTSANENSQRIQAGYIAVTSGNNQVNTPVLPTGVSNAYSTSSATGTATGVQITQPTYGFNVRQTPGSSINIINWICFQET